MTLRQIAAQAGLSPATVCLALKGDSRVAKATRERVEALAEEMGYRPHPAISALASRKWRRDRNLPPEPLAFVHYMGGRPDSNQVELAAARARGKQLGYAVHEYRLDEWPDTAAMDRVLYARGFRGIILGTTEPAAGRLDLRWERYSVVCLGSHFSGGAMFHRIRNNLLHGVTMALERIARTGCRRIGVILRRAEIPPDDYRAQLAAVLLFQRGATKAGVRCELREEAEADLGGAWRWVERRRPDAVLAQDISYYWHFRERGLRMPEDIRFAAVFLSEEEDRWSRPVAGLLQDLPQWGDEAVRMLDAMIYRGERGVPERQRELLVPIRFREAESLGAVTPA